MRKRIMSLLLCLIMALSLLPATAVTAFAESATQTGTATLIGFEAGKKAGDAYIQNNGMTILDAAGTDGKNPMYSESKVGQTAILSPYCPPYGMTQHPKYVYNDYSATAIIVQNTDKSGTQRRLLRDDTFKAGMTYRFTFQDTSWPVNRSIKGGGYLGELTKDHFTISGAEVVKVERVAQRLNLRGDEAMQGFFYNVWIKIDGTEQSHKVQYASNNVTVERLNRTDTSTTPAKTGYAEEGDTITVKAAKSKTVGSETLFFTGWKVSANGTGYTDPAYIQYYCNLTQFTSNTSGDPVTCSFLMGDKDIEIEALYGKPGSAGVGSVTFNNVKLWVMPPIAGANGVAAAVPEFDGMGATYRIEKVEWLEDNETGSYNYLHMDPSKTFDTANKCYTMRVVLKMNSGYAFTDKNGVTITINGKPYGTGTANTLYNAESRTIPVTYSYSEASRSLAIYIPADGTNTRLDKTRYADQAALTFSDGKGVAAITGVEAYKADEAEAAATATAPGETLVLPAGKYTVKVNVTVSEAMHKLIQSNSGNGNKVKLDPVVMGLVNANDSTDQVQLTFTGAPTKAGEKWTYTYSAALDLAENAQYLLAAGLNLKATPLIPQYEYGEMRITDANLTTNAVIRGEADNSITGNVYYTNSCMFEKKLTTDVVGEPEGATLKYQWQKLSDRKWENISGATNGQYTPTAEDVEKQIRVVVSANGYSGSIIGAARTVEKGIKSDYPARPELVAQKASEEASSYTQFKISNFDADNCEYVYTQSQQPNWSTDTQITTDTVTGLSQGQTYNVFVRYKETDTTKAGTGVSFNSVKLQDANYLARLVLKQGERELSAFGTGNKIYVKNNETVTLSVTPNPTSANTWETFTFKTLNTSDARFTVTSGTESVGSGSTIPTTITIKGTKVGGDTLGAYHGTGNSNYGTWSVEVYESLEKLNDFEILAVPTLEDVVLNLNGDGAQKSHTLETVEKSSVTTNPAGVLDHWNLVWKVQVGSSSGTGWANEDGHIKIEGSKVVAVAVTETPSVLVLCAQKSVVGTIKPIAYRNVTVTADTSTTSPDSVAPHTHTYGAYTNNGDGTHTATCTVEGCGARDYAFHIWNAWTQTGENHTRTCTKCDAAETGAHSYVWVIDTPATIGAAGKKHEECSVCDKKKSEDTSIAALTPVDKVVVSVAAPAHNGTAQNATVTGTGYTVANTVFYAPDGTAVMPGEKFAANTQYTAYVTLEAKVDEGYVFAMKKDETNVVYKINDKQYSGETPAYSLFAYTGYETVGGEFVEVTNFADSRDTITLTYEFKPTGQNSYYYHGGTTTTGGTKNSATTADPGVLLYGMMALSSYTGTALLVRGKKKHD